jgi:hypothetical protein
MNQGRVPGYGMDNRGSILGSVKNALFATMASPSLLSNHYGVSGGGGVLTTRSSHETSYWFKSNVEMWNAWSYLFTYVFTARWLGIGDI